MAGAPVSGRDWGGYGAIIREARALDEAERTRPLIDCPLCGTPLQVRADGWRNCEMGHYTTRQAVRYGS
jgi:hypothetical protein